MRISKNKLMTIITEELASISGKGRLSDGSADNQIDAMLIRFETESVNPDDVQESLRAFSLKALLEAPEEEEEEEPAPPVDDEPSFNDSTEVNDDAEGSQGKPPLDVDQYAQRVARLVQNYQNLLDIETVILNRAKKFLIQNYDEPTADAFEETLERQFDLSLEPKDNEPRIPAAVGAGPGGV
tara:strand:+ start:1496 stop:2044 length:549 start_codon:yes stop_codon:yes gene_type:complete